jgi:hypothetical protein
MVDSQELSEVAVILTTLKVARPVPSLGTYDSGLVRTIYRLGRINIYFIHTLYSWYIVEAHLKRLKIYMGCPSLRLIVTTMRYIFVLNIPGHSPNGHILASACRRFATERDIRRMAHTVVLCKAKMFQPVVSPSS